MIPAGAADNRAFPPGFSTPAIAEIDRRLEGIQRDHAVRIPLAIESGSRAWGFPSPDSDYDCRFVFVRSRDDYLSPWPKRDVIETPLVDEIDLNGWELGKALKLLLKGNAVIVEWLRSPITYVEEVSFREVLLAFATEFADRRLIGRHYLHLGERQRRTYFGDGKEVPQKKIFYALRPAAALRWLRLNPDRALPPMRFQALLQECAPPAEVEAIATELIARKSLTRELGSEMLPAPIAAFIDQEFAEARRLLASGPVPLDPAARAAADALFRSTVLAA